MDLSDIEYGVATHKISAAKCFTLMKQHIRPAPSPTTEPPTEAAVYEFRGKLNGRHWRGYVEAIEYCTRNYIEGIEYRLFQNCEEYFAEDFDGQWSPKLESFFEGVEK